MHYFFVFILILVGCTNPSVALSAGSQNTNIFQPHIPLLLLNKNVGTGRLVLITDKESPALMGFIGNAGVLVINGTRDENGSPVGMTDLVSYTEHGSIASQLSADGNNTVITLN